MISPVAACIVPFPSFRVHPWIGINYPEGGCIHRCPGRCMRWMAGRLLNGRCNGRRQQPESGLPFGHTLPVPPWRTRTKRMLVPLYCVLPPDRPRPPLHTRPDEGGFGSIIGRHAPHRQNSADVMPLTDFCFAISRLLPAKNR